MSTKKNYSRSRKKANLLKNRLDFHVPEKRVDPSKSKNIPSSKLMEERVTASDPEDENEDDDYVYEDWEERVDDDNNNTRKLGIDAKAGPNGCSATPKNKNLLAPSTEGRTYPPDLWFLIAKHVDPESVQTFGRICRGSRNVVRTFQFWAALYQRTYNNYVKTKSIGDMNEELKISRVIRPLGVKYHVVRALFNIHPPFQEMLDRQKLNSIDFDSLTGNKCASFWLLNPAKSVFIFNMLLERPEFESGTADKSILFNDTSQAVMYNPHQDSSILQIVCDQFVPVISPMGFHIADIKYNTSRDMRNMRLELGLTSTKNLYMTSKKRIDETRVFDPVISARVLPWWHPNFPKVSTSKIPESSRIDESWDSA